MTRDFLAQCEREPLHLSGEIQAHGALLVLDSKGAASHASENMPRFLGLPTDDCLGHEPPDPLRTLVTTLSRTPGTRRTHLGVALTPHTIADVTLSRNNDESIIIELVEHQSWSDLSLTIATPAPAPPDHHASHVLSKQDLVERIADLTGFQRVMYYQFRHDGHGEVVAEARRSDAYGSYLGLRFPASDIPQIARQLYLKNPWRLISDATSDPIKVHGKHPDAPDLTYSDLRSVSPVHRVYLSNMGVRASLSFPIAIGNNLLALITAHHQDAQTPSLGLLESCAAQVHAHTLALSSEQTQRRMNLLDGLSHRFTDVRTMLFRHGDLASAWSEIAPWLLNEFRCTGATLTLSGMVLDWGQSLEEDARTCLDEWIDQRQSEFVWMSDSLSRQIPNFPLSGAAGALVIQGRMVGAPQFRLYLTRGELIEQVTWGGNPDKPVEHHDGKLGIAPRRSFEKWVETRLGYSAAWDNESRLLALRLRELLQKELTP